MVTRSFQCCGIQSRLIDFKTNDYLEAQNFSDISKLFESK